MYGIINSTKVENLNINLKEKKIYYCQKGNLYSNFDEIIDEKLNFEKVI